MTDEGILHPCHWKNEDFKQRMTYAEWRRVLLNRWDSITVRDQPRKLKAKNLGAGVVEVFKEPMEKVEP